MIKQHGLFTAFVLLVAPKALADLSHYADIPVGDRAVGLGGAYTAVSDDPSAIYYNPGGLAFIAKDKTSISGNAYLHKEVRTLDGFDNKDFIQSSGGVVPAFFGDVKIFGEGDDRLVGGFGIAIPTNEAMDQEDRAGVAPSFKMRSFYEKVRLEQSETHFSLALARKFGPTTGLGLTLGLVQLKHTMQQFAKTLLGPLDNPKSPALPMYAHVVQNMAVAADSNEIEAMVGVRREITANWSAGAALAAYATVRESLSATLEETVAITKEDGSAFQDSDLPDGVSSSIQDASVQTSAKHFVGHRPPRLRAGLAYQPSRDFLWTLDGAYIWAPPSAQEDVQGLGSRAVANIASGVEVAVPWESTIRMGLFSNRDASTPVTSSNDSDESMDYYGMSLGVGHQTGESVFSVSAVYQEGKGRGRTVSVGDAHPIRDMRGQSMLVQASISGSF